MFGTNWLLLGVASDLMSLWVSLNLVRWICCFNLKRPSRNIHRKPPYSRAQRSNDYQRCGFNQIMQSGVIIFVKSSSLYFSPLKSAYRWNRQLGSVTIRPILISKSAFLLAYVDSLLDVPLLAIEKSPIFWAHADSLKPKRKHCN